MYLGLLRIQKIKNNLEITLYFEDNSVEIYTSEYATFPNATEEFKQYLYNPYLVAYKVEMVKKDD